MPYNIRKLVAGALGAIMLLFGGALWAENKPVKSIFGGSQPMEWLIRAVAPESLCALNFDLDKKVSCFFREKELRLPVIGGFNKSGLNPEILLKIHPDYVILSPQSKVKKDFELMLKRNGIAILRINLENLDNYPTAFIKLAEASGNSGRGKMLAKEYRLRLKDIKKQISLIPAEEKKKIYYAAGSKGLHTVCGESGHAQVIAYAGGKNIIHNGYASGRKVQVQLEQIVAADPDVIIIRDTAFMQKIRKLPVWRDLRAVKTGNVWLIPGSPTNWFDVPHTYMQLLGARWLASKLYPHIFPDGYKDYTAEFYRIFLNIELDKTKWNLIEAPEEVGC
ncbi:MAG: ABC transporter substrate-binding protein [Victivallales bacterium]|nr:ABC transporter substrate-binding protein [Victivallales bacterium]